MKPERIRLLRERLGRKKRRKKITRAELAELLGVSESSVWKWELPKSDPHHRNPSGPARKLIERIEGELFGC